MAGAETERSLSQIAMYDIWKIVAGIVIGELVIISLRAGMISFRDSLVKRATRRSISKWQTHVRRAGD